MAREVFGYDEKVFDSSVFGFGPHVPLDVFAHAELIFSRFRRYPLTWQSGIDSAGCFGILGALVPYRTILTARYSI
jgi:hypothetical protein